MDLGPGISFSPLLVMMAIFVWPIVTSVVDHTENTKLRLLL
jgi:hypothetical protein